VRPRYEPRVAVSFAPTTLELSTPLHKACAVEWPLFADVPESEMREVLQIARRRRFSRGEVVFHRDDPGDSLHLIAKGRFAIRIMTPLGDTATIAVRGPGESFGEMALVSVDARRSATVTALEESETLAVYKDDFARVRRKQPAVDQVLIAFLAREVRRQNELLLEALYVPVERRVIRRLVELTQLYPAEDGEHRLPLTQEVLAELAGTSRATVNRVLNEEQRRGTVELRRGRTLVRDLDALTRRSR
jgi:CRP/FNR family transcriptional regulator, cyclic AMP receptor protein